MICRLGGWFIITLRSGAPRGCGCGAHIQDRDGARLVLAKARHFGWLRLIFADSVYNGSLPDWIASFFAGQGTRLQIVSKIAPGFQILPKRWVVERSFAWLGRYRLLSKDYEAKTSHSEAFIYIAACSLMSRRLARLNL